MQGICFQSPYALGRPVMWLGVVLGLVIFGMSSMAFAQQSESDKAAMVLELIRAANDAFEAENYTRAYEHYLQAREVFPNEAIHFRLGQTAERLGKPFEAVEHYDDYLALGASGDAADRVKARLPELRASLPGRLIIDSTPQGAQVYAAGTTGPERLGRTPLTVDRPGGEVSLEFTFPEHRPYRKTVTVEAGTRQDVSAQLEERKEDDEEGVVTEARERAPEVAAAAREPSSLTRQDALDAAPDSEHQSLAVWGWSAVGLGAAVLATGGAFTYLQYDATEQVNSYDKRAPGARASELDELKTSANGYNTMALVSYIVGGVITAGGIGILVYDSMRKPSPDIAQSEKRLKFDAGGDHQGAWLSVSGRF